MFFFHVWFSALICLLNVAICAVVNVSFIFSVKYYYFILKYRFCYLIHLHIFNAKSRSN